MNKGKVLFQSILYVLLFLAVNFGTIVLVTVGYNYFSVVDVNTTQYVEQLASFLEKGKIWIVLLSFLILFPVIYRNLKRNPIKINFSLGSNYLYFILIGISTSLILNVLMYDIGFYQVDTTSISFSFASLLSTCILGPVLEEIIFRTIIYRKLKEGFSVKTSIFMVSLLFGIFHFNVIQGIYAFLFSLVITYIYEKKDNFLIAIIIHCFGNLAVSLLFPLLLQLECIFMQLTCLLFIGIEIFCFYKLYSYSKKEKVKKTG